MEEKKVNRRTIQGVVVSDKMNKTITVLVTGKKKHPIYIQETRPLSKDKYFRLLSIVERAK